MSCSGCTKSFSLFSREHGCPSCGFSFCSSCLKHSITVKSKQQKVCSSCNIKFQTPVQQPFVPPPPEALQKRLASQPLPKVLTQTEQKSWRRGTGNLAPEDQKIANRLSALHKERQEMSNLPSEEEVRDRLDRLKGVSSTRPSPGAHYMPPDTRTSGQRADQLFTALAAEVDLESRVPVLTAEQEISARLAKLRGETVSVQQPSSTKLVDPAVFLSSESGEKGIENMNVDEVAKLMETVDKDVQLEARSALCELKKDRAIQEQLERLRVKPSKTKRSSFDIKSESSDSDSEDKVLAQILAEVKLEDRLSPLAPEFSSLEPPEPNELPWCVICNADATLRCNGCEDDLYCTGCFREGHRGEDLREHTTQNFKK